MVPPSVYTSESPIIDYMNIPQYDGNMSLLSDMCDSVASDSDQAGHTVLSCVTSTSSSSEYFCDSAEYYTDESQSCDEGGDAQSSYSDFTNDLILNPIKNRTDVGIMK